MNFILSFTFSISLLLFPPLFFNFFTKTTPPLPLLLLLHLLPPPFILFICNFASTLNNIYLQLQWIFWWRNWKREVGKRKSLPYLGCNSPHPQGLLVRGPYKAQVFLTLIIQIYYINFFKKTVHPPIRKYYFIQEDFLPRAHVNVVRRWQLWQHHPIPPDHHRIRGGC